MGTNKPLDPYLRADLLKLLFTVLALVGAATLFLGTPALSGPTLISLVATLLLSPPVAALERRGYNRTLSIVLLFAFLAALVALAGAQGVHVLVREWDSVKVKAPEYFGMAVERLRTLEVALSERLSFLGNVRMTEKVLAWGNETGQWFVKNGASLAGDLVGILVISPILTFFFLNDGPHFRKRFFQLVPNRFFEPTYTVVSEISSAISDYLRAKLVEASLVGLMTTLGLWAIGAPYALVLGLVAGITNILPYVGPFLGLIPAVILVWFDPGQSGLMAPLLLVYLVANVIDNVYIFPVLVAQLVNLHPLLLIAVVTVGQQYHGLVGMLISIPIASALKVIATQIYRAIYERRMDRDRSLQVTA